MSELTPTDMNSSLGCQAVPEQHTSSYMRYISYLDSKSPSFRGAFIYSALDSLYMPTTWNASIIVSTSPVASIESIVPDADNIKLKPDIRDTPPEADE